jgi:uncharacterized SAM-binding protein YcdF (DUF218 family)
MFFILSKVLAFLTVPSNLILGLGIAGMVLLLTRFKRIGVRLMAACLLLLVVVGILPIGTALIGVLENRFPAWKESAQPVDGIIVLGGPIDSRMSLVRGSIAIGGEVERFTEAAILARRYPSARVVFTGGNPSLLRDYPPEAVYAVQLLELLGVPASRVTLEDKSRNTAENATLTKALAQPKPGDRWVLVTSAMHMPRSVGVFRKAGFSVEPYPVDWHTLPDADWLRLSRNLLGGLGRLDAAAHEWVGLIAYWLTGRTSELLPGPTQEPADCCAKPQ